VVEITRAAGAVRVLPPIAGDPAPSTESGRLAAVSAMTASGGR
jgi:hypothetical protein